MDSESEVPAGQLVVFSAHGVSPQVHANAAARQLRTVDATCPLVTKVHAEARLFASLGYSIFLVGHAGHDEVEGTLGEAPAAIQSLLGDGFAATPFLENGEPRVQIWKLSLSSR